MNSAQKFVEKGDKRVIWNAEYHHTQVKTLINFVRSVYYHKIKEESVYEHTADRLSTLYKAL